MSIKLFTAPRRKRLCTSCLFSLLMAALLAGGCAQRQITLVDPGTSTEQMPSYVQGDDAIPLTPGELKALNSTGQLDRGLSQAALNDVAVQYKYFLRKARTTMERFSQRSEPYLAQARQVFRQRGLPEELAFLAIVESGYNAKAVSHAGASGAWQFMPYTGMKYGLNQDWWMDERLDPYKSAEAAADYLAKLYGDFKDWHLAIAAYNAGEGKISRALEGTGAKNFFELKEKNHKLDYKAQLREETQNYVPRFLAICKIMRNLDSLGFASVNMNKPATVARVQVRPGTDLMGMAKAVDMSWAEFRDVNMAHKRYVTHADRATYVYVPVRKQAAASSYASRGQDGEGWKNYTAGKSENWQTLSRKSGVPVAALQSANRGQSLRPGMKVRLPAGPDFKMPAPERTELAESKNKKSDRNARDTKAAGNKQNVAGATGTHKIQAGENLTQIARSYDTDVSTLMALNDISDARQIRAGQNLRVPKAAPASTPARGRAVAASASAAEKDSNGSLGGQARKKGKQAQTYVVQSGDTLWGIARKHNISTDKLLALNKTNGKSALRPGDKLLVSEF